MISDGTFSTHRSTEIIYCLSTTNAVTICDIWFVVNTTNQQPYVKRMNNAVSCR